MHRRFIPWLTLFCAVLLLFAPASRAEGETEKVARYKTCLSASRRCVSAAARLAAVTATLA